MTKSREGVLPRTDTRVRMPPGAPTPRSVSWEQAGPRSEKTDERIDTTRGESLPPIHGSRQGWVLVRPPHDKR
jgi:hypothetical protein